MIVAILVFFASQTAFAHPPSNIGITSDPSSQTISVIVYHDVANPKTHYIKEIDIAVNGKRVIEDKFTMQSENNSQQATYELPDLKNGDKVTAEAFCNVSGQKSVSMTVK